MPPPADLATRCTACGTLFRVVPDQLRVSAGWVRCGRCAEVFNAAENLVDVNSGTPRQLPGLGGGKQATERWATRPAAPPAPAAPGASGSARQRATPPAPPSAWPPEPPGFRPGLSGDAAGEPPDIADTQPWAPDHHEASARAAARLAVLRAKAATSRPGTPDGDAAVQRPADPAAAPPRASGWRDAAPPSAGADDSTGPASRPSAGRWGAGAEPSLGAGELRDQRQEPPWDAPEPPQRGARRTPDARAEPADGDDDIGGTVDSFFGFIPPEDREPPAPDAPPAASAEAAAPPAAALSPEQPEAKPSFLRKAERAERWRRPQVRAALAATAAVAALGLLGQVTLAYRDQVAARFPATRAALVQVCEGLGCSVQPPRAINSLVVDSSALVRVERSSVYKLQVGLRNATSHELALPALDLSLTDSQGRLIARRVLLAEELLAQNATPEAPAALAGGRELVLQATLQSAGEPIAGYTIELFYP